MPYLDTAWKHSFPEEPVRIVSEIDAGRWETRKLEFYADGRVGWAAGDETHLGTELAESPLPTLAEINADPQFEAVAIDEADFEALWRAHAG
ncbi:MAG TPA: hypothetical protein VGN52_06895 [Burkholderiales bacterium]